jgi:hypothetical protein
LAWAGISQAFGLKWKPEAMKPTQTIRTAPKTVDDYIARFSSEVQKTLKKLRATIRKAAPRAEEKISYQIPAFFLEGSLVY